jgi:AraC-like DNA-binding protein
MNVDLNAFADRSLWDQLDETAFWVKDLEGRFVWVNLTLAEQAQAPRAAVLGTRDSDWFLNELASVYMEDDATLIKEQRPMLNKAELVMSPDGGVGWHVTSKYPHYDHSGQLIGSYGMSRPMEAVGVLPPQYSDLSRIVSHARREIARGVTVKALAKVAHMSLSTLERTVRRHLRITPQELLQRIRMNRARHLLTASSLKIGEIALECGYESFSAFSRAFRKAYGCAPGEMRGLSPHILDRAGETTQKYEDSL